MEWFIIAARLICHICKVNNYSYLVNNSKVTSFTGFSRMGLIAEVHFYRPAFLFNLPMLLWVRRYYKSLWLNADIISILHNLSESANHGCFTGNLGVEKEV